MPSKVELRAFAGRSIENVAETLLAEDALLSAEPLAPPANPRERRAWETRRRERRAAVRRASVELVQLLWMDHLLGQAEGRPPEPSFENGA
jgi:hypothetical protein